MDRERTLHRIEQATNESEILAALRDFVADPANCHDPRLATLLGNAEDVPGIALEITRFRIAARTQEIGTEDLEAVFARASVRLAELLDHTGGWKAYRQRVKKKDPLD
jgi:hypothetical protein